MIYSVGAFPKPRNPPYSVRTLHIRGNLTGQKLTMGETQTAGGRLFIHQYFLSPAAVPPSVDRPLRGNAASRDAKRERTIDKKRGRHGKRVKIQNIHTFLTSVFLFSQRWIRLSGWNTAPPRHRQSQRDTGTEIQNTSTCFKSSSITPSNHAHMQLPTRHTLSTSVYAERLRPALMPSTSI